MARDQVTAPTSPPPSPLVAPDEEGGWRRPSPRLRGLRRVQLVACAIPALVVALALPAGIGMPALAGGLGAAVVLLAGGSDVLIGRRVAAWGFTERADDLLVRRGVMFRRLTVIPYGRMQFVDVTVGPFERMFGLATVKLHTAAAATDARIPGLEQADAAALRDRLSALGESNLAGL